MASVRFLITSVCFYILVVGLNAQRLNRVQDIEVRLYHGVSSNVSDVYRLPSLINLFKSGKYRKKFPVVLYVHGFEDTNTTESFVGVIDALLKANYRKKNICGVDWSNMAGGDYNTNAMLNTNPVATALAKELKKAVNAGYTTGSKIEPVGYALGGQLVGFLGRSLKSLGVPVKKIISLDPAGPGFSPANSTGDTIKKTDAKFVYVMHTNAFVLGTSASCGTHDFWVNSGALQRGCIGQPFGCSQKRAYIYYIESLNNSTSFLASKYENFLDFMGNFMPDPKRPYIEMMPRIGLAAAQGNYFCSTNWAPPYGRGLNGRHFSL